MMSLGRWVVTAPGFWRVYWTFRRAALDARLLWLRDSVKPHIGRERAP